MPEEYTEHQIDLRTLTAADGVPKLTDDEIDRLLAKYAIADSDGLTPDDEDWVPTYNMRAAAREGWKLKMAKAAELTSTDLDGDRMSANQIFQHCREMLRQFGGTASPVVAGTGTDAG